MDKTVKMVRKQDIMVADMAGSAVMLDIATNKYYNLGEIGGAIWALLEKPMTLSELIDKLTAEYDVTAEQCEKDTVPFIESMMDKGLIKLQ